MRYAEVAVNSPVAQPRTFSYAIPKGLSLTPGHAVWVPFGSRLVQGIVFEVTVQPSVEEPREIAEVIDPHPLLRPHQVKLARWIGEHYLAPLFEAATQMLPPGFERRLLTFIHPIPNLSEVTISSLTSRQKEVLGFLQKKGRVELRELKKALGKSQAEVISASSCAKGW